MIKALIKFFSTVLLNFFSLVILLSFNPSLAENKKDNILIPSYFNQFQFEIGEVRFIGNNSFNNTELQNLLASRPTDRSLEHRVLLYYDVQMKYPYAKKIIPQIMINSLDQALMTMINEVQFYDQIKAENDVLTLQDYYNQNGYHKAKVSFTFEADKQRQLNVLSFFINEDTASSISGIVYQGLDSLPKDLGNDIKSLMKVRVGERFIESKIYSEVRAIHFKLLDNGYYYANFDMPLVLKDTIQNTDSVIITFHTGKRQKIDGIDYIDSTKGQKLVLNDMKDKQLDINIGDWYSISKINRSNNNLMSLGTFDIVSIDTSSIFKSQTDSTLSLVIFTQYRKQQEWGLGLYINRTAIDNFTNAGLEASYSHRNIGGIAQNFNTFLRFELQDISRLLEAEPQAQAGISLTQPLWFTIGSARFGAAGQLLYSYSKIFSELQLSTISMPLKIPIKFPDFTYIQYGSLDLLIERQVPMNFESAYQKALDKAETVEEKEKTKSSYKIYESLNRYCNRTAFYVPTAFIFGGALIGDKRNDIFNPSSGYYLNGSLDLSIPGFGIAEIVRPQMSYYLFTRLSPTTVFAFKIRAGYTYWYDQNNSYVPIERQFFAGGANSVRGWSSRRLRYPQPKASDFANDTTFNFFQDFIGSGVIIEGTAELRFRIQRPSNFGDFLANIISDIVLTSFIDWGNTFHWYSNYNYPYKWYEYITGLAIASGVGIGYITPVGPFRVDLALPIYDPSAVRSQWIFTRENVMKELKFHIGLGYSF